MTIINKFLLAAGLPVLLFSCTAPRVINQSGKVTPKGHLVAGVSATGNVSGEVSRLVGGIVKDNINVIKGQDTVRMDQTLEDINKAGMAYAVDPIGFGYDIYLRYGIAKRMDIGYKHAGKANVLNYQYQFLGDSPNLMQRKNNRLYGSIALQFSWQKYELPSVLKDLQGRLGYSFKRKDLMVPLIFSYSFGNQEEYGSFSFGAVYSYTWLDYSTVPDRIVNDQNVPFGPKNIKQGYQALGGFMNVKFGYKYVYLIPAVSFFYQNYGDYELLNGKKVNLRGMTFVPSLSLQFKFNKPVKKEE